MEKKMTDAEARKVFDVAAENVPNPDDVSKIEFLREYLLNGDFRKYVSDTSFALTNNQGKEND